MHSSNKTNELAYRLSELENGVGTIEIWHNNSYATVTLRYGVINGVRWIDMRSWEPSGNSTAQNIKRFENSSSANTAAITEQIANYQKVYENIGKDDE